MAAQGLGAMVTMPIAGALVDKFPVGRIVPFGLVAIVTGMFLLTQIDAHTSYWGYILPVLFLMGLGMGGTMMPIMTSALKSLRAHDVARGSTLLNITQQIGSSMGVAIISVFLTTGIKNQAIISQAQAFGDAAKKVTNPAEMPALLAKFPEVAKVFAKFGTDQAAAQAGLLEAVRDGLAVAFAHLLGGGLLVLPHARPRGLPAAQERGEPQLPSTTVSTRTTRRCPCSCTEVARGIRQTPVSPHGRPAFGMLGSCVLAPQRDHRRPGGARRSGDPRRAGLAHRVQRGRAAAGDGRRCRRAWRWPGHRETDPARPGEPRRSRGCGRPSGGSASASASPTA